MASPCRITFVLVEIILSSIGVTVVLLTCSYKGKEFIRIGYYVNVDYADEQLRENPPETPQLVSLYRTVLTGGLGMHACRNLISADQSYRISGLLERERVYTGLVVALAIFC